MPNNEPPIEQVLTRLAELMDDEISIYSHQFDPLANASDFAAVKRWAWGRGLRFITTCVTDNGVTVLIDVPPKQRFDERCSHDGTPEGVERAEREATCRAIVAAVEAKEVGNES